jgi:hypothetical protein
MSSGGCLRRGLSSRRPPVIALMAALKRSLAQDTRQQSAARQPRKSKPGPQPIGASDHCFYDSRRPKEEGGGRDRAGSRRHEPQKA